MSSVTVVIPAHGGIERLATLLHELNAQASPNEPVTVVISDDASPTPLAAGLSTRNFPSLDLSFVRSEINGGPGVARNRAIERVTTEWVAFLDADELPGRDWLLRIEAITSSPSAPDAVEGPISVGPRRPGPFEHATIVARPGTYVAGNVLFRRSALLEVGGFDSRYYDAARKLHFREDVDLFFRLEAAGKRIVYDDELQAFHPPLPASLFSTIRLARRYYFDPLLSREHPARFRRLVGGRGLALVSLRRARHLAAVATVGGTIAAAGGVALGRRAPTLIGTGTAITGWGATAAALSWNRRVRPSDLAPLALAAAVVPFVYLVHFYRGMMTFRHRPRF